MRSKYSSRHRGAAIIYVIVILVVMLGFCSFAVDLGRVQTAKTELRRATDAAARAAMATLPQGTSAARSAAETIAALNKCDGAPVTLTDANVIPGYWDSTNKTFSTSGTVDNVRYFRAVRVGGTTSTTPLTYNVPLLFGSILGKSTCTVSCTSVAALMAVQMSTQFVSAQSNLWLAGQPKGTLGSVPDGGYSSAAHPYKHDIAGDPNIAYGQPGGPGSAVGSKVDPSDYNNQELYNSILQFQLSVTPGSIIEISQVSGQAANQGEFTGGTGNTGPTGGSNYSDDGANPNMAEGTQTTSGSEHGITNIITPINSLNGVFLDNNAADNAADPNYSSSTPGLDFSTQSAQDYTSLSPKLAQTFYAGDGQTSGGTQQMIVVPSKATRLFLGTMDGHEWANNVGGFNATITQYAIEMVK